MHYLNLGRLLRGRNVGGEKILNMVKGSDYVNVW